MKFNLKNRPAEPDYFNLGEIEALRSYNYRAEKFLDNLEKELREMLKDYSRSDVPCEYSRMFHLIKEILGE